MRYIWLIPLLPGIGAAINGLVGIRYFSRKTAGLVACATMTMALGLALVACRFHTGIFAGRINTAT